MSPSYDDRLDIRVAGEWTKRGGYTFNKSTNQSVDGRDLWSGRVTWDEANRKAADLSGIGSISPKTTIACDPQAAL